MQVARNFVEPEELGEVIFPRLLNRIRFKVVTVHLLTELISQLVGQLKMIRTGIWWLYVSMITDFTVRIEILNQKVQRWLVS